MKRLSRKTRRAFLNYGIVIVFFIVFQTLVSTGHISNSMKGQLIPIVAYVIMALSLNLVVGISGELSLGHAGFMSVGAFTGVVVAGSLQGAIPSAPVRLILSIFLGALLAGIVGVIIGVPVLRLNGDYLAIVTLAFGEIIKNLLNVMYIGVDSKGLHFSMTDAASLHLEADGKTIREFWGTTSASLASKKTVYPIGTEPKLPKGQIPFIDCEKGQWRSMRIGSFIGYAD